MYDELRALGLNLIPIPNKTKIPSIQWKQFQLTPCNLPLSENAAVICGPISGDLVVIDIDSPEIISRIFPDLEALKEKTMVVQTGSGGIHVYAKPTEKIPRTIRLDGPNHTHVDIQAGGVYVLAPGSIHPNGKQYKLLSNELKIANLDLGKLLKHLNDLGFNATTSIPIDEIAKGGLVKGSKIRNDCLYRYSLHLLKEVGLDGKTALHRIEDWNKTNLPPIPNSELLATFNSALRRAERDISKTEQNQPEQRVIKIRELRTSDMDKTVTFNAMISVTDEVKGVLVSAKARCFKCDAVKEVEGDGFFDVKVPYCVSCEQNMSFITSSKKFVNRMDVLLEEFLTEAEKNSQMTYAGIVNDENVFKTFSGQRKTLTGKLTALPGSTKTDGHDLVFLIREVKDMDEREDLLLTEAEIKKYKSMIENDEDFVSKLSSCFNPDIQTSNQLKKMLLLTAIGGCSDITRRPESHILLIGDTSMGKTELIKYYKDITPKFCYFVGAMASKAGLASGMVKINNKNVPRAGVLAQYSGGFVGCDELDKTDKENRHALLECMEQQTVTLIKAGTEHHLDARTTVIAGANPKFGQWDEEIGLMENVNLDSYLLSRFDMMWRMKKESDLEETKIAQKIVGLSKEEPPLMDSNTLRRYINYVKLIRPKINDSAKQKIVSFYEKMRKPSSDNRTLPMQRRQLEGMLRYSAAIARVRMKEEITEEDVDECIQLYRDSLISFNIDTKGDVQQFKLTDYKMDKEKELMEIAHQHMDENEEFLSTDVVAEWAKTNHFKSFSAAQKHFEKLIGEKFLYNNGRYRLTRLS